MQPITIVENREPDDGICDACRRKVLVERITKVTNRTSSFLRHGLSWLAVFCVSLTLFTLHGGTGFELKTVIYAAISSIAKYAAVIAVAKACPVLERALGVANRVVPAARSEAHHQSR